MKKISEKSKNIISFQFHQKLTFQPSQLFGALASDIYQKEFICLNIFIRKHISNHVISLCMIFFIFMDFFTY